MQISKTLYVFDMDDTLVKTPKLEDIISVKNGEIHSGDPVIDGALKKMLNSIKEVIDNLNSRRDRNKQLAGLKDNVYFQKDNDGSFGLYKNNIPAGKDFIQLIASSEVISEKEKEFILKKLDFKDNKVILSLFSEFFQTEGTVGVEINESVVKQYESAKNKMIVTGRTNGIRKGVKYILFNVIGLEKPNCGLFLYEGSKGGIQQFKADVVLDSIEANGWNEIHFFEDRGDWLDFVEKCVAEKFPDIRFHKYLIK